MNTETTFKAADLAPAGKLGDMWVGRRVAVCRVTKAGEMPDRYCFAFLRPDGRGVQARDGSLRIGETRLVAGLSPDGIRYVRPRQYSRRGVQSAINILEGQRRA